MKDNKKGSSYQTSSGFSDTVSILAIDENNVPIKKTDSFNFKEEIVEEKKTVEKQAVESKKKDFTTLKNGQNLNQVVTKLYQHFNSNGLDSAKDMPVDSVDHQHDVVRSGFTPMQSTPPVTPTVSIREVEIPILEPVIDADLAAEKEFFATTEVTEVTEVNITNEAIDAEELATQRELIDEDILIEKLASKLKPHIKEVIYQQTTQVLKAKSKELFIELNQQFEKELPDIISQVLDENLAKIIKEHL